MAAYAKDLNTAEIAYAAIDEVRIQLVIDSFIHRAVAQSFPKRMIGLQDHANFLFANKAQVVG